jgi:hypothetical protein
MKHIYYGFLSVSGIILPLKEFKLQREKVRERRLIVWGTVLGGIFLLVMIGYVLPHMIVNEIFDGRSSVL